MVVRKIIRREKPGTIIVPIYIFIVKSLTTKWRWLIVFTVFLIIIIIILILLS